MAVRAFSTKGGFVLLVSWALVGCTQRPESLQPPELDPAAATERALAQYDTDSDGVLTADELEDCPGLRSAVDQLDKDGDGKVSAEELRSLLEQWQREGTSLVAISCLVRKAGRPLAGAVVEFIPEAFLGDAIRAASGTTGSKGIAAISVPDEQLPESLRGRVSGVHCGIYRVVVKHSQVNVPAKYSSATTLGRIVSRRDHSTLIVDL